MLNKAQSLHRISAEALEIEKHTDTLLYDIKRAPPQEPAKLILANERLTACLTDWRELCLGREIDSGDYEAICALARDNGWQPFGLLARVRLDECGRVVEAEFQNLRRIDITSITHLSRLAKLDLSNTKPYTYREPLDPLVSLVGLTGLKVLKLDGTSIFPSQLSHVAGLGGLQELSLRSCHLSDRDISPLAQATNLTALDLGDNSLRSVEALRGLFCLRALELDHNFIHDIEPLNELCQLTRLSLDENGHMDLSPVTGLRELQELSLRSCNLTDRDISPLAQATNLTALDLGDNSLCSVEALRGLFCLRALELDHNFIHDIEPLNGLCQLTRLGLGGINGIVKLHFLAHLNVEDLDLENTGMKYGDLRCFTSDVKTLVSLNISNNDLSDVSGLGGLTRLTTLIAGSNQFGHIPPLASLANLQTLDLQDNGITDISKLAGLTSLRQLNLSHNYLTDIEPLAELTSLESLDLSNNQLCEVHVLKGLAGLQELRLEGNRLEEIAPLSGLTNLMWCSFSRMRPDSTQAAGTESGASLGVDLLTKYQLQLQPDGSVAFSLPSGTSFLELFREANQDCLRRAEPAVMTAETMKWFEQRAEARQISEAPRRFEVLGIVSDSKQPTSSDQELQLTKLGLSWPGAEALAAAAVLYYCQTSHDFLQNQWVKPDPSDLVLMFDEGRLSHLCTTVIGLDPPNSAIACAGLRRLS